MCKCPHSYPSSAKIGFCAYCSQYTHTKEKSEIKKYNSHIRKLSTYLVIAAGMKMAESNKNPFYHLVQFVRLEKWD